MHLYCVSTPPPFPPPFSPFPLFPLSGVGKQRVTEYANELLENFSIEESGRGFVLLALDGGYC